MIETSFLFIYNDYVSLHKSASSCVIFLYFLSCFMAYMLESQVACKLLKDKNHTLCPSQI